MVHGVVGVVCCAYTGARNGKKKHAYAALWQNMVDRCRRVLKSKSVFFPSL